MNNITGTEEGTPLKIACSTIRELKAITNNVKFSDYYRVTDFRQLLLREKEGR